ncbi:hypothetical protein ACIQVL_10695 [Streptomyces sp. NPDC090499]|uniref:hypothetical protein n=1 Tax=Streptomyces sp. NPDC090499 TaxID=3365965 RepID=UPI0037FBCAAB
MRTPIQVSSARTLSSEARECSRWDRLNRSGVRQFNRALHTITLIRMRLEPATKTYVARHVAEGSLYLPFSVMVMVVVGHDYLPHNMGVAQRRHRRLGCLCRRRAQSRRGLDR